MIIDAHTHVGPFIEEKRTKPESIEIDYDQWKEILDQNDIDKAVIMPTTGYDISEGINSTRKLNDKVQSLVEEYDRFVTGIGTVEPTHQRKAIGEIERLGSMENISGVMWHHRHQGSSIDDPTTAECLAKMEELDLVAYIHSFPESQLESLDKIKKVAPLTDSPIIVLDSLGLYSNVDTAIELATEFENIYFDTALLFSLGLIVERLVDEIGSERLVFGSDLYTDPLMYRYSPDLYQVQKAEISEKERNKILSENIKNILDL
jgi:predicted TIM-barrel fold metal-dependent hydrolase